MKDFLLLVRGYDNPTPEEKMDRMQAFVGWMQEMTTKGLYVGGQPLEMDQGRMVMSKTEVMTDGPFMASKELVGGYIIVKANDLEDAVATAQSCPILNHCHLEVRQLQEMN